MTASLAHSDTRILGPKGHDFSEVSQCLRSFEGEDVVFVANPGNAGDALINLGMYQLFDRIGLVYRSGTTDEDYTGKVVIYSGGGALVSAYENAHLFLERIHKHCKALVLLPHTVRAYPEMVAAMGPNCYLFARELGSFDFLKQHATRANIALSHDLAFFLSDELIANEKLSGAFLSDSNRWFIWTKMIAKLAVQSKTSGGVLNARRTDIEAAGEALPARNHDMSELFASGQMTREACGTTIRAMRSVMKRYTEINTDRLHVAVLAALIGKPVTMRDNSYGKNSSIFDHSIDGYYNTVDFVRT
jgi:exopolysaccharide biosynthesis predicted pyruvyltransferase EpsI